MRSVAWAMSRTMLEFVGGCLRKFGPVGEFILAILGSLRAALHELWHPPASQIPFLDGLRAIAVILVINGHLNAEFAAVHGANWYSRIPFVANGWIGVDLFFVLSGFFIGGQLWKELRSRGTISFPRFVIRRGLRIWPLYLFTFACVLIYYGSATSAKGYGWSDLAFITNYHNRGIVLGSWSLCTEEQFYILTPLALLFLSSRVSLRRFRNGLWALLAFVPLMRIVLWVRATGHFFAHDPKAFEPIYYNFHTHCDGLIVGLIIAHIWVSGNRPRTNRFTSVLIITIALIALVGLHTVQKEVFSFTGLALVFGALVWYGLNCTTVIFNSRLFYWLSRLSFGMYLNHEYMKSWVVHALLPRTPWITQGSVVAEWIGVAVLALCSASIALVTFCVVEFPFLEFRKKLMARSSVKALSAVAAESSA